MVTSCFALKKHTSTSLFDDPIIAAVRKYERHPSILKIKEKFRKHDLFSFYHVNPDNGEKIEI